MVSLVLAGVGGQGIITVANIVGKAALIEGKNALMTELHGMAQRGGKIVVEVRIGDYKSAIIPARSADIMLAFEELEGARNLSKLKESGVILLNRRMIHPVSLTMKIQDYPERIVAEALSKYKTITVDADQIAMNLGNKRVANTAMIGATFSTGLLNLSEGSLITAIKESLPEKHWDINKKAFERGKIIPAFETAKVA
ncbi:MAG: indolepyruvate oxidoreductase subunit beta [Candidatus Thermoplasmatota archaeon]|nr:indolepyruvate oxidoreductase subunit beta [Candidatus Thermoplasmatota archaeon]